MKIIRNSYNIDYIYFSKWAKDTGKWYVEMYLSKFCMPQYKWKLLLITDGKQNLHLNVTTGDNIHAFLIKIIITTFLRFLRFLRSKVKH